MLIRDRVSPYVLLIQSICMTTLQHYLAPNLQHLTALLPAKCINNNRTTSLEWQTLIHSSNILHVISVSGPVTSSPEAAVRPPLLQFAGPCTQGRRTSSRALSSEVLPLPFLRPLYPTATAAMASSTTTPGEQILIFHCRLAPCLFCSNTAILMDLVSFGVVWHLDFRLNTANASRVFDTLYWHRANTV